MYLIFFFFLSFIHVYLFFFFVFLLLCGAWRCAEYARTIPDRVGVSESPWIGVCMYVCTYMYGLLFRKGATRASRACMSSARQLRATRLILADARSEYEEANICICIFIYVYGCICIYINTDTRYIGERVNWKTII